MTCIEQRNREEKELRAIEIALFFKFKEYKNNHFLDKDDKYEEHEIVGYDRMIHLLAQVVQQHLSEEDLNLSDLEKIEKDQWHKWFEVYYIPEKCCDRCSGSGCNYCLGVSY